MFRIIIFILSMSLFFSCESDKRRKVSNEKLFNFLKASILSREAFSPIKNERLGIQIEEQIEARRAAFLKARSTEELYFELLQLSNLRKDSHLKLRPLFTSDGADQQLPIRLGVDFSDPTAPRLMVTAIASNYQDQLANLSIGDYLVQYNSYSNQEFTAIAEGLIPASTLEYFYTELARLLTSAHYNLKPLRNQKEQECILHFEKKDGQNVQFTLDFASKTKYQWNDSPKYDGFDLQMQGNNLNVWTSTQHDNILLLEWLDFESDMPAEVDSLMNWASENGHLESDLIIDAIASSGGSNAVYPIRRLSSKPFKVVKGNLRISEITRAFIRKKSEQLQRNRADSLYLRFANEVEIDNGEHLLQWLNYQVEEEIWDKKEYTDPVVFKKKYTTQNDTIYPAPTHFTGKMVALFGPFGASQVDQFAAMLIDNQLAYSIGMSTAGNSNTWEWTKRINDPLDQQTPICDFKWTIGQTWRPNDEPLEGNPPLVDEWIPTTAENIASYPNVLLKKAIDFLQENEEILGDN